MQTIERAARLLNQAAQSLARSMNTLHRSGADIEQYHEVAKLQEKVRSLIWPAIDLSNRISSPPANAPKAKKTHSRRKAAPPVPPASSEGPLTDDRHSLESDRGPAAR